MSGMGAECIEGGPRRPCVASVGVLIVIDLSEERVHLNEPDDFGRLSVAVHGGGATSLGELVHRSGLGRVRDDGSHVVVDPIALRSLAGTAATPQWEDGLAAMCRYAASKGWVEDDGGIVAHIESGDDKG
jgi:hypothetical protein